MLVPAFLVATVAAEWLARVVRVVRVGPSDVDSQQYHLPFAARFVQQGWLTRHEYSWIDPVWAFYPASGEVVHSIGMVVFARDVASPFVNLLWLGLFFLAVWCWGSRFEASGVALVAGTAVAATPLLAETQSATATNDIAGLALLIAALALLAHSEDDANAEVVGAVAAALAVGTKVTFLAPVGVLALGMIVARRGRPVLNRVAVWAVPMLAFGAYYYVRNLVRIGNPVPGLPLDVGPLPFESPTFPAVERYGFAIADYVTDRHFWTDVVPDGLADSFGIGWPLLLAVAVVGLVAAAVRAGSASTRVSAIAGIASAAAYLVTPTTAYGPPGNPFLFGANLRFLVPSLAIGAVLAVVVLEGRSRRAACGALALFFLAAMVTRRGPWRAWPEEHTVPALLLVISAAVAGAVLVVVWRRARGRARPVLVAATTVSLVAAAFVFQREYLDRRYVRSSGAMGATEVARWSSETSNARIGIAGLPARYPLFGIDLTNEVRYIGERSSGGNFASARTCPQWRGLVNAGGYDFVVTGPEKWLLETAPEREWTATDRAVALRMQEGPVSVFEVRGRLDPRQCPPDAEILRQTPPRG